MRRFYKINKNLGFSLLESLIALSIFLIATAAFVNFATQSIRSASIFRNKLIASNLAQEGMELVINQRDFNNINSYPPLNLQWLNGLEQCESDDCTIAILDASGDFNLSPCGGSCPALNFDSTAMLYNYESGSGTESTPFTRTVRIEYGDSFDGDPSDVEEVKIIVKVEWQERFSAFDVTLEGYLYNWFGI
ncbi:prepilin-type N-terminal cleavage/methylation domain-containing protein [Patescibacteria group bacterium]